MSITTDFLLLYQELNVTPECSIEHFRRAYRRRVSELHPDRTPDRASPASLDRLQSLTRLHDAAMQFHNRHGRLPGANQPAGDAQTRQTRGTPTPPSRQGFRNVLIFVCVIAVGAMGWMLLPSDEASSDTPEPALASTSADREDATQTHTRTLTIGMNEANVLDIQGEPTLAATDRWEYGPSYVRFEHHKLAGWYSSPLYPLKVGTQHAAGVRDLN